MTDKLLLDLQVEGQAQSLCPVYSEGYRPVSDCDSTVYLYRLKKKRKKRKMSSCFPQARFLAVKLLCIIVA